jgi:hypothetical protein
MKGDVMTDPRKLTIHIKVDPSKAQAAAEFVRKAVNASMQNMARQMMDYAIYGEMWGVDGAIDGTCRVVPDESDVPLLPAPPKEQP